ncbi:MAG: porin [Polyangiaceae bacterium]
MRSVHLACVSLLLVVSPAFAQTPPAPPPPAPADPANTPAPAPAPVDAAPPAPAPPPPPPPAPPPEPAAAPLPAAAAPPVTDGPRPAPAGGLKLETASSSVKIGFLLQPAFEVVGSPSPALDSATANLFVRRVRLLVGGTLFKDFEYFFDTDYPDLFKAPATTGTKNTPGLNVQDAYGTWKAVGDMLKVDLGYMLPPLNHNAVQGATTLYGWDYFANSFRHSAAFNSSGNPIGRDAGLQLRGLLLDGLLEYRLGVFQGRRNEASATQVGSRNMFRLAGRVQVNLLDPEPGFFYAGTYLGAKKIVSIGGSFDFQDSYKRFAGDVFVDLPLGDGVFTAQVNVVHADGDDFLVTAAMPPVAALPRHTALMGEVGYLFDAVNLSPIVRFEKRWETAADPTTSETRFGGGLAFWPYGHNVNLKAFYQRVMLAPADYGYNQFNLQTQFFVF